MNRNRDPEEENALVDELLRDEIWESASAAFKAEALRAFRGRTVVRRLTRLIGSAAALAFVAVCGIYWLRPVVTKQQLTKANRPVPIATAKHELSDEALLAFFPAGSCFIAEIDGQKELVFLDPNAERVFVSGAGASQRAGRLDHAMR